MRKSPRVSILLLVLRFLLEGPSAATGTSNYRGQSELAVIIFYQSLWEPLRIDYSTVNRVSEGMR